MMLARWKNQMVRDFDGLVCASGEAFTLQGSAMVNVQQAQGQHDWIDVGIMAQAETGAGLYTVKCGESAAHGSIGVIVLESRQSGEPIWTFVSKESNPFDQIVIKGSYVLVLSTSGTVFRFVAPLDRVAVLPG